MWKCRWRTLCPAAAPEFVTSLKPSRAMPSSRASWAATPNMWPSIGPLSSVRLAADVMCSRGMSRMCTGALGEMSRNAITTSSSKTMSAGISVAAMRQKRQSSFGIERCYRRAPGVLELRLGHHQEPDRANEPGHDVADVALSRRPPLDPRPCRVRGLAAHRQQPSYAGSLHEKREQQVRRIERQRDQQPGLSQQLRPERADEQHTTDRESRADHERAIALEPQQPSRDASRVRGTRRERQQQARREQSHGERDVNDKNDG